MHIVFLLRGERAGFGEQVNALDRPVHAVDKEAERQAFAGAERLGGFVAADADHALIGIIRHRQHPDEVRCLVFCKQLKGAGDLRGALVLAVIGAHIRDGQFQIAVVIFGNGENHIHFEAEGILLRDGTLQLEKDGLGGLGTQQIKEHDAGLLDGLTRLIITQGEDTADILEVFLGAVFDEDETGQTTKDIGVTGRIMHFGEERGGRGREGEGGTGHGGRLGGERDEQDGANAHPFRYNGGVSGF